VTEHTFVYVLLLFENNSKTYFWSCILYFGRHGGYFL